jgi:biopolymer transport protein ExbD
MIDMVFQLIAFFMILINFADADQDQRVQLPSSALAKPPQQPLAAPITIQMVRGGQIVMSGQLLPTPRPSSRCHREVCWDCKQENRRLTIIILPTRRRNWAASIIQVCQEMGFEKFTLRTRRNTATDAGDRRWSTSNAALADKIPIDTPMTTLCSSCCILHDAQGRWPRRFIRMPLAALTPQA